MGSVGREQSGFASTRAWEVESQKEMRPGSKGEEKTASTGLLLVIAVKGWGSHSRRLLKAKNIRIEKRRRGSRIALLLRMLIMLLANWNVHHGRVKVKNLVTFSHCLSESSAVKAWSSVVVLIFCYFIRITAVLLKIF